MKRKNIVNILVVLAALAPLAYLAFVWNDLPQTVTLQYDAEMQPSRVGPKSELLLAGSIMAGVSILLYFGLQQLHRFDPKRRQAGYAGSGIRRLATVLVLFFAAFNVLIIASSREGSILFSKLLFPLLGLLLAAVGNYMHHIKPNYFAGLRLPWTLSDDENWKKTHQLGGKIWFWCGLLLAAAGFFIPMESMIYVFVAVIMIMILIPAVYSYKLFRKKTG